MARVAIVCARRGWLATACFVCALLLPRIAAADLHAADHPRDTPVPHALIAPAEGIDAVDLDDDGDGDLLVPESALSEAGVTFAFAPVAPFDSISRTGAARVHRAPLSKPCSPRPPPLLPTTR